MSHPQHSLLLSFHRDMLCGYANCMFSPCLTRWCTFIFKEGAKSRALSLFFFAGAFTVITPLSSFFALTLQSDSSTHTVQSQNSSIQSVTHSGDYLAVALQDKAETEFTWTHTLFLAQLVYAKCVNRLSPRFKIPVVLLLIDTH